MDLSGPFGRPRRAQARPRALASRPFARLLSAQVVSQVGTQMNNTAEAWVLYGLTRSPLALGVQGLCFSAPMVVLPLLTGPLADRFDRLTLVRISLAAEAAQALTLSGLAAASDLQAWVLYVASAVDALTSGGSHPRPDRPCPRRRAGRGAHQRDGPLQRQLELCGPGGAGSGRGNTDRSRTCDRLRHQRSCHAGSTGGRCQAQARQQGLATAPPGVGRPEMGPPEMGPPEMGPPEMGPRGTGRAARGRPAGW